MRLLTRLSAFILAFMLLVPAFAAAVEEEVDFYTETPYYLQVKQHTDVENPFKNVVVRRTYPDTNNDEVDAVIRQMVDEMAEADRGLVPTNGRSVLCDLDVGAVIYRTGTSWMSFILLSQYSEEYTQRSMKYQTVVFDMETGARLSVADVIGDSSEGLRLIREAVSAQLNAYFPQLEAGTAALEALLTDEALINAPFSMSAACMRISYRADTIYADKHDTLMHVVIPYAQLKPYMTEKALEQTDNSRFKVIALTFDDGPATGYTKRCMNQLRNYAASATFFIVGERLAGNHYNVCREQNSAYALQSHSWKHEYAQNCTVDQLFSWKQKFIDQLNEMTGLAPSIMRAPGGRETMLIRYDIGYPLVHWSIISGDAAEGKVDPYKIANYVMNAVKDGDIVLMHDIRSSVDVYVENILENISRRGFMCVTVEELYMHAGIEMQPNEVYWSRTRIGD